MFLSGLIALGLATLIAIILICKGVITTAPPPPAP